MLSDLLHKNSRTWLDLINLTENVAYRLRADYEKGGYEEHHRLLISAIAGYIAEHPRRPLFPPEEPVVGLNRHFVLWLREHPPQGGGSAGEELRDWIRKY